PGDEIPEDLAPKLGNRIFGCDDCLDVCPYNVHASATTEPAFQPSPLTLAPRLSALAESSEAEFATWFRLSPIRRAKHAGFLRNVRTALRNLRLPALFPSST
ncbi:MAG: tRNA epoxyqueuosine(34) reductase QueG, partial [Nitrospiraceae bacterium]